jgi:tetratricopeptide (TPR) repeat protein
LVAAALYSPAHAQESVPDESLASSESESELTEEELAAAEQAAAEEAKEKAAAAALRASEREWYRTARDRFSLRMQEVTKDTQDYVKVREAEERDQLVSGYDNLLGSLEELGIAQRDLALDRFESFLERYPNAEYSSHIRFRLADLYFEVASDEFLASSDAYYEALGSDDLAVLDSLGEEPKLDLTRPVELYKHIIEDNVGLALDQRYERLDGVYLMLGFCYSDETSAQRDDQLARSVFRDLIREVPESELADRSHLFVGNYAFAEGDYAEAMAAYEQAVQQAAAIRQRNQGSNIFG